MNLISMEKGEKSLVTLTIEMDADTFAKALSMAWKKDAGRFNVPGFRRGKAPRGMIESIYGANVFYESAVNLTYFDAYKQVMIENGLEALESPEIEVQSINADGYRFVARVHVYPEVEIGNYKGLRVYRPPVMVSIDDIDNELARLQERNARLVTVFRPIQNNDTVTLDFEGVIDDIPFESGWGANTQLVIGSGRSFPGFEEQLVGHSSGDHFQLRVTLPNSYEDPELAGREAVFSVAVHEVKETEKPELDDEFAKDVSAFDTMDEFRADLAVQLAQRMADKSEEVFESTLVEQILAATKADIPEVMVTQQQSVIKQNFAKSLSSQHMDLITYLRNTGKTAEDFDNDTLIEARRQVTLRLALGKIAELEGFEVSEEELEAEYVKLSKQQRVPLKEIKSSISERYLRHELLRPRTSQFIKENVFAVDQPPEKFIINTISNQSITEE